MFFISRDDALHEGVPHHVPAGQFNQGNALDALQGVLAGAMSPEEAMQETETEAERVRGKIKT